VLSNVPRNDLYYLKCQVLRRAKILALAVEDSGRLFGKVDTAAPGKVVRNAYLTFSPVFKRVSAFIHGRVCYINGCEPVR